MSVLVLSEQDLRRILREELRTLLQSTPRTTEDRRVTLTEAAASAGVSPTTIKSWADAGRIKRYGQGRAARYSLAEVLAVRVEPTTPAQSAEDWAESLIKGRGHG